MAIPNDSKNRNQIPALLRAAVFTFDLKDFVEESGVETWTFDVSKLRSEIGRIWRSRLLLGKDYHSWLWTKLFLMENGLLAARERTILRQNTTVSMGLVGRFGKGHLETFVLLTMVSPGGSTRYSITVPEICTNMYPSDGAGEPLVRVFRRR